MTLERRDGQHKTPFSEWIRTNPQLDQDVAGLCILDFDWIVHQYRIRTQHGRSREIQNMMCIEEKRYGKDIDPWQRDTLLALNQVLMAKARYGQPQRVSIKSKITGQTVLLRFFGCHLLRFSNTGPLDSAFIEWDRKKITREQLEQILRFELSPLTLNKRDERSHHGGKKQKTFPY